MDTRTGLVGHYENMQKLVEAQHLKEVRFSELLVKRQEELRRIGFTKAGRNEPCPCGSGRKFKRCCLTAQQEGE